MQPDGQPAVWRNTESFRKVNDALLGGSAVQVFPEGILWSNERDGQGKQHCLTLGSGSLPADEHRVAS